MTNLPHPYKGQISRHEARISFDVSKEDFELMFRVILPLRNSPNVVMATLFKLLLDKIKSERHLFNDFDTDNERLVRQYLQRCTFNGVDDPRPNKNVSRGTRSVRHKDKGTPKQPANTFL